jgi:hypothetical protein
MLKKKRKSMLRGMREKKRMDKCPNE